MVGASLTLGALTPLCYELAAEVSYPASESISAGIIVFLLNFAGFIFLFALPPLLPYNALNMLMLGAVAFAVVCFLSLDSRQKPTKKGKAALETDVLLPDRRNLGLAETFLMTPHQ